jgi:hypothetical protein
LGYSWKRARLSLKSVRNQELFEAKRKQLGSLVNLHNQGYIDLYFADESHFGLTPNVPYAWQHKDKPILLPARKSNRLTAFGLMTADCRLNYYLSMGSMNSQNIISYMDDLCKTITKKTIVVLDNAPIHRSKLFCAKFKQWQEQDLFIFFLPPYSPELNKIEILWRFIKYKCLPFDAFLNFQNLKDRLNNVLENVRSKYIINFY